MIYESNNNTSKTKKMKEGQDESNLLIVGQASRRAKGTFAETRS